VVARIRHITIDAGDPFTVSRFWRAALGFADQPDAQPAPGDTEVLLVDPTGRHPGVLFVAVPEVKVVKNRVHLDLVPDAGRDAAVDVLVGLGATLVSDQRRPDGTGWVVLADPEGNELCVERSAGERGEAPPVDTGSDEPYPDGVRDGTEALALSGMLEWYRAAVLRKMAGISTVTARTSPVRSGTTIAGLLKHLAGVEDSWFHDRFAGSPEPEPWASAPFDDDPDWEFHSALHDDVDDLVALYRTACERSRRAVAGHDLDDRAVNSSRPFTLRFAYVHLIEETARHLGHMDILREFLDGTTGE
jgi:uncharacterized damage-inducible protein DinB/predicted enzyme related to lactoylglutathione lyase